MPAMTALPARSAGGSAPRRTQGVTTATIAPTASPASTSTSSPVTGHPTAADHGPGRGLGAQGRGVGYHPPLPPLPGRFSSNRVAADDNPMKLMSIAMKPLCEPPFPLERLEDDGPHGWRRTSALSHFEQDHGTTAPAADLRCGRCFHEDRRFSQPNTPT